MNEPIRLWMPIPKAAKIIGVPRDGLYRDIRKGLCPFRVEVISGRLHLNMRDAGFYSEVSENSETRTQTESLATQV